MRGEQRLDFLLQHAIAAARVLEKRVAIVRRAVDDRLKQLLDCDSSSRRASLATSLWRLRDAPIEPGAGRLPFARHG